MNVGVIPYKKFIKNTKLLQLKILSNTLKMKEQGLYFWYLEILREMICGCSAI